MIAPERWWTALDIHERHGQPSKSYNDLDTSEKLAINQWKSGEPFSNPNILEKRLQSVGHTTESFCTLLAEPTLALSRRASTPKWLSDLVEVYSDEPPYTLDSHFLKAAPTIGVSTNILQLLNPFSPIINSALRRLTNLSRLSLLNEQSVNNEEIFGQYISLLGKQLLNISHRTLILELNARRLSGELTGLTSEARFDDFTAYLSSRSAVLGLINEYPTLFRLAYETAASWESMGNEFFERLLNDMSELKTYFSPQVDPGRIASISTGLNDSHRGGRRVCIVRFESGLRIVYKPRSLAVDCRFQDLLAWFNNKAETDFRTIQILDKGEYGWSEFVSRELCEDASALHRFYKRQGEYLCLLYVLGATDIHYENLIASGEFPIIVDLETIFSHQVLANEPDPIAKDMFRNSILTIGLLPIKIWGKEGHSVDLSGLGGSPGQVYPKRSLVWEDPGTDIMRVVSRRIAIPDSANRPASTSICLNDYLGDILGGFRQLYGKAMDIRWQLKEKLQSFLEVSIRNVLRTTHSYNVIMKSSYHPDALRGALKRQRFLDSLWIGIDAHPWLGPVIEHEINDLRSGDIPYFSSTAGSCDIFTSQGERIPQFFEKSGLETCTERLSSLGEADLARQMSLIVATVLATEMTTGDHFERRKFPSAAKINEVPLVESALAISRRLSETSFGNRDFVNWFGLAFSGQRRWAVEPLSLHLYDGLSGVCYFLAYLAKLTGDKQSQELAERSLNYILLSLKREAKTASRVRGACGAFEGWGGIVFVLTHLAALWERSDLLEEAESIVMEGLEDLSSTENFDIIGGLAGATGCILTLFEAFPQPHLLETAMSVGDRLLGLATKMESGWAWSNPQAGKRPLAGFSHGASGVTWALTRLARFANEDRFAKAAAEGMIYEASLFDKEILNWHDVQDYFDQPDQGNRFGMAWCHGAPGIGLARLSHLQQGGAIASSAIYEDIEAAAKSILATGFGTNHCLCHGDLGNLDFLLERAITFGSKSDFEIVKSMSHRIVASITENGWLCGVPRCAEVPGLMTGISGIGYELLRLAFPYQVPSVLLLQGPHIEHDAQSELNALS